MAHLVHNERLKPLAGALNTGATAAFTPGVPAPLAALLYNPLAVVVPREILIAGFGAWMAAASCLHWVGRAILGRLRE